jgi:hypothetical protein
MQLLPFPSASSVVSLFTCAACAAVLLACEGCVAIALPMMLDDEDTSVAHRNLERNQAAQMERMRNNPNISTVEYETMNAAVGSPGALPTRPATAADLEKRLEAEGRR